MRRNEIHEVSTGARPKRLIRYDWKADAIYILTEKGQQEEVIEMAPGVNLELNERGGVIGIEILNASQLFRGVTKAMSRHFQIS